jgi:IS605 OrfB family transposase
MITIKLPYKSTEEFQTLLKEYRRQQSICIRAAFQMCKEEKILFKNIRYEIQNFKGITIDTTWLVSGIMKADALWKVCKLQNKKTVIFGGKVNLYKYNRRIISKTEYKNNKISKLISIGNKIACGNYKFRLDLQNNRIIFLDNYKIIRHYLTIPKLKGSYLEHLQYAEAKTKLKELPLTVQLDESYIYLTFEPKQKDKLRQIHNRVFAIDSNPNSIGWSCIEILRNNNFKVIDSSIIKLDELNKQSTNKRNYEIFEISKFLVNKAKHLQCFKFIIEELSVKSKDHKKGKVFNKTVNNTWQRSKLFSNLRKRCQIENIEFVEINPAYTSVIGNTLHRNYPDPINATFEIARRGYFKYKKDKFYPAVPSSDYLNEQWKQTLDKSFSSWKELSDWIKNSILKYRVSLDENRKFFRMKSNKSRVTLINKTSSILQQ